MDIPPLIKTRRQFSEEKLKIIRQETNDAMAEMQADDFCIFTAGSFGRLEAGQHSDLDLFFVEAPADKLLITQRKERSIKVFSYLIDINSKNKFPPFSNDCEHLVVHTQEQILDQLGSRTDDSSNVFTLRMLLLLESRPLFNDKIYESVVETCVNSYCRDYYNHEKDFVPAILMNDIARYWYTLQMNYENRRNQRQVTEVQRLKQKVKNFKLKFSRRMTCFVSTCYLGSVDSNDPASMTAMVKLTPVERLLAVADHVPRTEKAVADILAQYAEFMKLTELSTQQLEELFKERESKVEMFSKANTFKSAFSRLVREIDQERAGFIDRLML